MLLFIYIFIYSVRCSLLATLIVVWFNTDSSPKQLSITDFNQSGHSHDRGCEPGDRVTTLYAHHPPHPPPGDPAAIIKAALQMCKWV